MKVRIIVLAESAYACLTDDSYTMDVRLSAGHSPQDSMREKAAQILKRAERIEAGAALLNKGSQT